MSTWDDNLDPAEPQPNQTIQQMRQRISEQAAQLKEAEDLRAENTRLVRQMAVRDAGLELNDRQRKALEATHEGEWSPEALRQTAADLGFAAATIQQSVPADELASLSRFEQAARGGEPPRTQDADAEFDARMAALNTEVRAGRMSNERASQEFDRLYRESGRPMNEH